ncbi:MAG: GAF domain-containing protein [Actinobacteria bacterium]|nr:GAF domain-containing protein [Actinomycetota bacterium]
MDNNIELRLKELGSLYEISSAITSSLNLSDVLKQIYKQISKLFKISTFYIALYDKDNNELRFELIVDKGKFLDKLTHKLSQKDWLTGWIIRSEKPLLIRDFEKEKDSLPVKAKVIGEVTRSWLGVPILFKDEIIGVMSIQAYEPNVFDDSHKDLLSTIANQVAMAIENAKLYEETCKKLNEFSLLNEVIISGTSTMEFDKLIDRLIEPLKRNLSFAGFSIRLIDERTKDLKVVTTHGYSVEELEKLKIKVGKGITGWVAKTGEPVIVPDVSKDKRYIEGNPDMKSEMCVPLKANDKVIGVLDVEGTKLDAFSIENLTLISTIASQISMIIEKAKILESEKKKSKQLEAIQEVSKNIVSVLDIDKLFQQIANLINNTFGYYYTIILLVDEASKELFIKAFSGPSIKLPVGRRIKIYEEGITGWVAKTGKPLLVNDVREEPRYLFIEELPDVRSELAVPIKIKDKVIGVLDVESVELNDFDESDLTTLTILAEMIAIAIENANLYKESEHLAITDGLTKLYNSRYFYAALQKELERSKRYGHSFSIIIFDIDDFKKYNDEYGHIAGDQLLQELARLTIKECRSADIIARYGGEEFVIILPETKYNGAIEIAERLRTEIKKHSFTTDKDKKKCKITISLGIAIYPNIGNNIKGLLNAADKALYKSKQTGKDRWSIDTSANQARLFSNTNQL